MEGSTMEYSVIVPVYNSEKTLEELVKRTCSVFTRLQTKQYEIILVDDHSKDSSWNAMQRIHKKNPCVKIIKLSRNFGQHNATLCGMNYATGDVVITIDDDLQHRPEDIPKLLESLNGGLDVVMACYDTKKHGLVRNLFTNINTRLVRYLFNAPKDLVTTSFRAIRKRKIDDIIQVKTSYPYITALIFFTTPANKIGNTIITHENRKIGKSGYYFLKLLKLWSNLIINYSTIPLVVCGTFGIIISFGSFIYAFWIILQKLLNPDYGLIGWNSIMVATAFLGGSILIAISIVGEYLRRILAEVSFGKPYLIETMEM
jgi:glycosyltransferase involved in cell wall biosynthesis